MLKKFYYSLFTVLLFCGFYFVKCQLGVDFLRHFHLAQLSPIELFQNKEIRARIFFVKEALADTGTDLAAKADSTVQENVVEVDCKKPLGLVKRDLIGVNLLGHVGVQTSSYGCGIWDATRNKSCDEVVKLLKRAGFKSLRFPGGCGVNHYNWRQAVGDDRKDFLFGIDEFLKV